MQIAQAGAQTRETLRARIGGARKTGHPVLGDRGPRWWRSGRSSARSEHGKAQGEDHEPEQPPR
jgi:hypothetical protein